MFNPDLAGTFELFSMQHVYAATFVFLLIGILIFKSNRIRGSKYETILRYTLGILTLTQELTLNIVRIVQGEWMISTSLPLQLCGLAVVSSSVVLLTKNKKLFTHTFFSIDYPRN